MLKTGGISLFVLLSFFYGIYSFGDKHLEGNLTESVFVSEDTTSKDITLFFVGDMMGHEPMINAAFDREKAFMIILIGFNSFKQQFILTITLVRI